MPPPAKLDAFANRRYALVIDAGSSGSRLQIYSWRDPLSEKAALLSALPSASRKGKEKAAAEGSALRRLPRVEKGVAGGSGEWQKKVEPGISSLASGPISVEATSAYLSPLLDHALASIPPSHHASTPVYILATAGMRLLPQAHADALVASTCQVLRDRTPFSVDEVGPLGPCGDSVRIISGEEEGLWGWVAVNYLLDGFGDPTALVPSIPAAWESAPQASDDVTPFGFLDMGGASTQIAFAPSADEARQHTDSLSSVKLRLLSGEDLTYDVFVASWLGYGTNKARERYVGLLVEQWEAGGRPADDAAGHELAIPDPCLPTSLALRETPKLPLSSLMTASSATAIQHASSPHTLAGTGSFDACLRSLQPLLNKHLPCPAGGADPTTCLFGGLSTPHIDFARQRFIGVSEYWYSSEHVFGLGGAWDFDEFERRAGAFCGEDWTSIEHRFEAGIKGPHTGDGEVLDKDGQVVATGKWGPEVEISRLKMQCFKAAWLVNVLHEGIGLPRTIDPDSTPASHVPASGAPLASLSKTEREAERKAREKGLAPSSSARAKQAAAGKKPHFQSVDTVGDTAISWTLGKMVIEASRDVVPLRASSAREPWFALPHHLGELVDGARLARLKPDGQGAYVVFGFLAMLLILVRIVRGGLGAGRAKGGASGGRRWKKSADDVDEEEAFLGGGATTPTLRPAKRSGSLWSLVSALRRVLPFRPGQPSAHSLRGGRSSLKHVNSSPAIMSEFSAAFPPSSSTSGVYRPAAAFASQGNSPPSSPRRLARPSSVDVQVSSADEDQYELSSGKVASAPPLSSFTPGSALPGGPPPRMQRRPSSQAMAGGQSVDFHLLPLREILGRTLPASSSGGGGSGGGWNDVPADLISSAGGAASSSSAASQHRSGVLTPPATSLNSLKSSRNSSRVDLTGLTGRNFSRANLMTMSTDDA